MKANKTNQPGIAQLRKWFKAMVAYQFSPLWVSDPIRHRINRPAILGDETSREKAANDLICLKWLADKIEGASK